MATESGFSNQKKFGEAQYKTIQPMGSDRFGVNTAQMYLFELNANPITITNSTFSDDTRIVYLEIPSHGGRLGDVVRSVGANMNGWEFEIVEYVDSNIVGVWNIGENDLGGPEYLDIGDDVKVLRWITATSDGSGALSVVSGPLQYVHDGANTTVAVDTVTPSNTRPLPVEIYGAGTTVNLTAGDINVQLAHTGATYDSTRIGDGTELWAIDADGSGTVRDADAIAELQDIESDIEAMSAKLPATLGTKAAANSLAVVLASDTTLPLPTGAASAANQATEIGHLSEIEGAVETIEAAIGIDGNPKPANVVVMGGVDNTGTVQEVRTNASGEVLVAFSAGGLATEATLSALNSKHNSDFGASAGAIRTASQIGNATGAADFNNGVTGAQTLRVAANLKREGNDLSYNAGAADANTLRVAIATGATVATTQAALAASFQEITNLTTAAQTFTAPANAKWCKIMNNGDQNMRIKMGGAATTTSGMRLEPGRSEDFHVVGDISVIAEAGSSQEVCVIFGA